MAEGVKTASFNYFLLFYYTQVLGLAGTLTGLALFIATTFDAITDPLAGSYSDRFRHRWGRRHPFMYASAIPLGLTFVLLFRPPGALDEVGLFLWLAVFAVAVRGSMTLYHVPHLALGAELSQDYSERTTIAAFRTFFSLAGIASVLAFGWLWFFRSTPEFESGQLNPEAYPPFGLAFGALMAVTVFLSAIGTHDRIPSLPKATADAPRLRVSDIVEDYVGALSNPSFRAFFCGIVVFFVMRGVQESLYVHMVTFFWRLEQQQILTLALLAVPGLLMGVPFWTAVSRKIDKRPAFLAGVTGFSLCVLLPPIAQLLGWFPSPDSWAYMAGLAFAGTLAAFCAAAGLVMAGSMMADVTDEHELTTGRRQEGIFFGALAFAGKSTSGLGVFLGGIGIDLIDFPDQAMPEDVSADAVFSLGVLYGPGIMLFAVVALVFLSRYRIDRARHAEIVQELERRRGPLAPAELDRLA
jgi:Na+/melibiose symporter-like transporter